MTPQVLHQLQAKADALRLRDVSDTATNVSPAQRAAQAATSILPRPGPRGALA